MDPPHKPTKHTQHHTSSSAVSVPTPHAQEILLTSDVLFVLGGSSAEEIKIDIRETVGDKAGPLDVTFHINEDMNKSHAELLFRMFPLAAHYLNVKHFVETRSQHDMEYGLVVNALASGIRELLEEYLVLLAQLDLMFKERKLTLQKLLYYIQPTMRTMETLDRMTRAVSADRLRGGSLLSYLRQRVLDSGGHPQGHDLFLHLLERASVPYFDMLSEWIHKGVIDDYFKEFLVKEKEETRDSISDKFWAERFSLRKEDFPEFLEPFSSKILTTGKHLNVIRECSNAKNQNQSHKQSKSKTTTIDFASDVQFRTVEMKYSQNEREYVQTIEKAYNDASKKLLDLLINGMDLVGRLNSLKHYFLLDQGDFLVHFLDIAEPMLAHPAGDVSKTRLEGFLEQAIRSSIVAHDPYHDDLLCTLLPYDHMSQLLRIVAVAEGAPPPQTKAITGLEAFTFDYQVQWPLSLVVSRKALNRYQLVFRYLFHLRSVERQLCRAWVEHQATKELELGGALGPAFLLRQKMLFFVQALSYYMSVEVIEPNYARFILSLSSCTTLDDLLQKHNDFLDTCLKESLLTDRALLEAITRLLSLCTHVAHFVERSARTLAVNNTEHEGEGGASLFANRQTKIAVASAHAGKIVNDIRYTQTIEKQHQEFHTTLRSLLLRLNEIMVVEYDARIGHLISQLEGTVASVE